MSKKGGYKIIDLKNANITTGNSVTIEGIYEDIEGNYYKSILLSGIVINGVELSDAFVDVQTVGTNFVIEVYGLKITITDEDSVSFVKNIIANQTASVATDVSGLVTDFNELLTKLKASGFMEADSNNVKGGQSKCK